MSYRREDFEPRGFRLTGAQLFLLGAVVLTLGGIPGFIAGMELQTALYKEAKRIEDAKPKRATPSIYVPLLDCNARDYLEYRRTCRGRENAGRIGNG